MKIQDQLRGRLKRRSYHEVEEILKSNGFKKTGEIFTVDFNKDIVETIAEIYEKAEVKIEISPTHSYFNSEVWVDISGQSNFEIFQSYSSIEGIEYTNFNQ